MQLKKHSRELIEAFTAAIEAREEPILEQIQGAIQNGKAKFDTVSMQISANAEELKAFAHKTEPQNLDSLDIKELCDSWVHSLRNDVVTGPISPCHITFVPGARMSSANLPYIGRLGISKPVNYATGKISQIVFGTHGSRKEELGWPSRAVVCPITGNIVVADNWNSRVQIFNSNGQFLSMFEKFDFDACTSTGGIAITSQQNIAVCDNHRVQLFTAKGEHIRTVSMPAAGSHRNFSHFLRGMACHQDNFYICDPEHCQVQVVGPDGVVDMVIKTGKVPYDVAVCPNGEIIVIYDDKLHVHHADGSHKATIGRGDTGSVTLEETQGVTVDNVGHIIVSDRRRHNVHVLEQSGKLIRTFGSHGKKPGQFDVPMGVACTHDGRIVVVDRDNHRIQVFSFD